MRITHLPTGITSSCQNERSQAHNKATALAMVKSRLWQFENEQRQKVKQSYVQGQGGEKSWGHQIRSVVMHPYTSVKDHRSLWETTHADAYLRGEFVDDLIFAHL